MLIAGEDVNNSSGWNDDLYFFKGQYLIMTWNASRVLQIERGFIVYEGC